MSKKPTPLLQIELVPVDGLLPYARNSRTHSKAQVGQIAASIREFGFTNPVLIDGAGTIIAGHGRVMAAQKLGLENVPCLRLDYLTEAQRRAYVIADNKLALNAGWDEEMLRLELLDLEAIGYDIELTGFSAEELEALGSSGEEDEEEGEAYTNKIEAPTYEPSEVKPELRELFDNTKAAELKRRIQAVNIPGDLRGFLMLAAERHTVFDFAKVADYYAHSEPEVQALFEDSALVIVDFDAAIASGFVELSKRLQAQAGIDAEAGGEEGGDYELDA